MAAGRGMDDLLDAPRQRLRVPVGGRTFLVERAGDLESLWEDLGHEDFGADERLPYWVELWPSSLSLARFLAARSAEIDGLACLDLGCGLGLTALAAAAAGAKVLGLDYERPAVAFARHNAALNGLDGPLWVQMDWREPGFAPGAFQRIWGADILYEKRFFEPLERLFDLVLAPGGRIWIAEADREVSRPAWDHLRSRGWAARRLSTESVASVTGDFEATVHMWELTRQS